VPERDAATCNLGDGYLLIAAGVRREKSGDLTADLMLKNGVILHAERAVLNTDEGRQAWATRAQRPDGPTTERMQQALLEYVLPDALAILQQDPKKATQADQLVGMVSELASDFAGEVAEAIELFHDPGQIAYATLPIGEHRETWPLASKGFRQWMARRFHEQHGKTPNAQSLVDATNVLAGKAIFDGPECPVHLRLAENEGTIYVDLCNPSWDAIAIDRGGWRIVANPPVKFRRTRGMLPLPTPVPGGSLSALRRFLNLPEGEAGADVSWTLTVAWVIAAFRPRGPYPILITHGEQGSAKSTGQRALRALIDPNKAPIRSLPRDERDLMISATNGWCLSFDNLSHLQDSQSDVLCRISTGGGFAARELYSDQDETILDVQRPIALNGIEELATRGDLMDRSILNTLSTIPPERRVPEKQFWHEFEQERPAILGAILDVVSTALRNEATVTLDEHPRMADFAQWIVAAEPALPWEAGEFMAAYRGNQKDANDLTLDASPVAQAVREFMDTRSEWIGTATELLTALEEITDEKTPRQKSWPASARTLSNVLRRLAPNLRAVDVDVTFGKAQRRRVIQIERRGNPSSPASPASPAHNHEDFPETHDAAETHASVSGDAMHPLLGASPSPPWNQDSLEWRGFSASGDDGDDRDAKTPAHSDWAAAPDSIDGGEEGIL
jgi:hypothetical protein